MQDSERIAIAAHLHVALRRKTGRVTDTEWMASNPEYGRAMVAFALAHARENGDEELERLALRLKLSIGGPQPAPGAFADPPHTRPPDAAPAEEPRPAAGRYIGGLR
jgi:hypothetical protein